MLEPTPREILFRPNSKKRRHFVGVWWTLNTEPVYSIQGPERCATVLYHDKHKQYAVVGNTGKHGSYEDVSTDKKKFHYKDIFSAKAFAVKWVRGYTLPFVVK